MPFDSSSENLPSYVKKLPDSLKSKWIAIFNRVYNAEGEEYAFIAANNWLSRQRESSSLEAKTKSAVRLEKAFFKLSDSQLIKRSKDGEEYVDFVLTDTGLDSEGVSYPEDTIKRWVEQINSGDVFVGDINHEEYDRIALTSSTPEQAAELIKRSKKGIAKAIKAIFDKGKMFVRAIIDKRYKKVISKAKGVSLEALINRDYSGAVTDGELLGFTFAVGQEPYNSRAVIL